MNELHQQILHQIVLEHGRSICDEPRRLKALLFDHLGTHPGRHERAVHVLMTALDKRIPMELLGSQGQEPMEAAMRRLAVRLQENTALTEEAAGWAVEAWGFALGVGSAGAAGRGGCAMVVQSKPRESSWSVQGDTKRRRQEEPTAVGRDRLSSASGHRKWMLPWLVGSVGVLALLLVIAVVEHSAWKTKPEQASTPRNQASSTPASSGGSPLAELAPKKVPQTPSEPPLAIAPFNSARARELQLSWANHLGGQRHVTNSIGLEMVLIPPGEFKMGSQESSAKLVQMFARFEPRANLFDGEHPAHRVRITRPFYLGAYHVTVGQFRQFVTDAGYQTDAEKGSLPTNEKDTWRNVGFEQTDEHPVVNVSWNDATEFCKWLSRKEGKDYRLPTEAEWEYACRAGTTTQYWCGDDPEGLAQVANVADATANARFADRKATSGSGGYEFTLPTGSFRPNPFGLSDMHGNAWQWCADWFDERYYDKSAAQDPEGPSSGSSRVLRGGSCAFRSYLARSASRLGDSPGFLVNYRGFRVARNP